VGSEEAHEVQSNYGQLLFSRSRLDEAEALLRGQLLRR
jgi:hypothetical protein